MSSPSSFIQKSEDPKSPLSVQAKENSKPDLVQSSDVAQTGHNSSSPSKRPKTLSKKSIVDEFSLPKMSFIPIVNKDTTNSNTYDLEFLLNPEVQKIAKSCHRLTQSSTVSATGSFVKSKDHIKKNILNTRSHYNSMSSKELQIEIIKPKSKKLSIDVEERFYSKAKKTEEKLKTLKELKEIQEINSCTFKPKITTKRKEKSYDEFYEYMAKFKEQKEKKIKMIQEEEQKAIEKSSDCSYQPKLCEKSIQIVARKSTIDDNTFERLHNYYKCKGNSVDRSDKGMDSKHDSPNKEFQPKVSKKSQNLQRTQPVENILYNDAIRRKNKEVKEVSYLVPKFITSSSEKVLITKLKREFEEGFFLIDIDSTGEVNYTRMIELFRQLSMVKDDSKREEERLLILEAWKMMSNDNSSACTKPSLLVFILAVMGFYEDWMGQADNGRLVISQADFKKIHTKYDLFYRNRSVSVHKNPNTKSSKDIEEYSFHPQIGGISENLYEPAKSRRYNGKIEDYLIAEKQKVSQKIEEKRVVLEELGMEECSFHPMIEILPESCKTARNFDKEDLATEYFKQINSPDVEYKHKGEFLHELSKVYKAKKQFIITNEKEKAWKRELEPCTFTPHLEKRILPGESLSATVKKPEKTIKKAQDSKKKPKLINPRKKSAAELLAEEPKEILETEESKEEDQKEFIKVVSNTKGLAKISVNLAGDCQYLDFNLKSDDPASVVMSFSAKFKLEKDQEYKLVKKLTLLKYTN